MSKKTKLAVLIGAAAAVVSALVLVIAYWDKLLALCPCRRYEDEALPEEDPQPEEASAAEEAASYNDEELSDFADLDAE